MTPNTAKKITVQTIIMNQCNQICSAAMRVTGVGKLSWLTPGPPGKSFTLASASLLKATDESSTAAALLTLQNTANGANFTDSRIAPACVMPDLVVLLAFIVITFMDSITNLFNRRIIKLAQTAHDEELT
jgi:hypothetical protein